MEEGLDADQLQARVRHFAALHAGENDCRIVAECEDAAVLADALATFDTDLVDHLKDEASVMIATPEDCWHQAAIPPGASPQVHVDSAHPLFDATWWRW